MASLMLKSAGYYIKSVDTQETFGMEPYVPSSFYSRRQFFHAPNHYKVGSRYIQGKQSLIRKYRKSDNYPLRQNGVLYPVSTLYYERKENTQKIISRSPSVRYKLCLLMVTHVHTFTSRITRSGIWNSVHAPLTHSPNFMREGGKGRISYIALA